MSVKHLCILITTGLFPPDIGGPATYVPLIAKSLVKRGHKVTVVAPRDKAVTCPITDPPYRLVQFHRAHSLRYLNFFLELWRAFVVVLREAKACDLIFINGLGFESALAGKLARKPTVVKVVGDGAWELAYNRGWTALNLDEFQKARGLRSELFRAIRHMAAKQAKAVITPSRYLGRIVEGWGVARNRIKVVYNAFVAPGQQQSRLPEVYIPPDFYRGFRLITVGRLVSHKHISDIIRVLNEMKNTNLVVAGDGPRRWHLQRLVNDLALTDRVFFTSTIAKEQVWRLLEDYAQALVLNSVYEGFPHVLLEAAFFGVPIVATAVGGTPELVEDGKTGLLIQPESPEDLLTALQRLQEDADLRHRLSVNARRATERFSVGRMVNETEQVLLEAAQ